MDHESSRANRDVGVRFASELPTTCPIYSAMSVWKPYRSCEVLLDVMDVVVDNFKVGTATGYANSPRQTPEVSPEAAQEYTACSQPAEGA